MDPTESILSTLDFSIDHSTLSTGYGHATSMLSINDSCSVADTGLDFFNTDLDNNFLLNSDDDYLLSAFLNDQFLNSFADEGAFYEGPSYSLHHTKSRSQSPKTIINNKNKNNIRSDREKSVVSIRQFTSGPKVYLSRPSKKQEGTSILVKNKMKNKFNRKRSLLSAGTNSLLKNSVVSPNEVKPQNATTTTTTTSNITVMNEVYLLNGSLKDHDYCRRVLYSETAIHNQKQQQTEIQDILHGYCTDDVVLNELPECLSNLIDLGGNNADMIDSEDLLNGLNDVCNFMTDQFIEENLLNKDLNLPDLNLTEEDFTQPISSNSNKQDVDEEDDGRSESSATTKDVQMNIIYSHCNESNVDSFDSASVTTGCTDESFVDEKDCLRLKAALNNSKRHRSLSSSSPMINKRKRRFSTRSSINSSDSMSDSSQESSSSRSSSPERAFDFAKSLANHSNDYHAKNFQKFQQNKQKKYRPVGKSWTRAYSSVAKKGKCQVMDFVSKQKYTLETSGSSQPVNRTMNINNEKGLNENVLYIGNIPDGINKSDIRNWFSKFGTIEDVQLFTNNKFALVTYQNVNETNQAIKHGNDDRSHPEFILTFGKDRRKQQRYNDVDYFSEKLDFRIENENDGREKNGGGGLDVLLKCSTVKTI